MTKRTSSTRFLLISGAVGAVSIGSAAAIQDASSDATAVQDEERSAPVIDEIVVTAQRREESALDVPISVVAVTGETLQDANIDDISELGRIVPGFSSNQQGQVSNVRINIRGVGAASGSAIESSAAFFVDDVYVPRPGALTGNFYDLSSVQVLRGPQGTLFGRNASVGAVVVQTAEPTDEFEGYARGEYGRFDTYQLDGAINLPISEKARLRVAGITTGTDGFGRTTANDARIGSLNSIGGRARLAVDLADDAEWMLSADYLKIGGDGTVLRGVITDTVTPRIELLNGIVYGGPGLDLDTPFDRTNNDVVFGNIDDEQVGLSSRISFDLDGYTLRLINGYRDWKSDQTDGDLLFSPVLFIARDGVLESESQSHELQIFSPEDTLLNGRLGFVAGLYYFQEDYGISEDLDFSESFCVGLIGAISADLAAACSATNSRVDTDLDFVQDTESLAAYAQADISLTDALTLTLGGRYTDDEKSGSFVQENANATGALFRAPERSILDFSDDRFTWRINLAYQPTSTLNLFANYTTGFKSGGFNSGGVAPALTLDQRVFASETVDNYEAGVKARWADGRLLTNLVFYRLEIDNFQDRSFDGSSFIIDNAGGLRQQGFEGDIVAVPVDGLTASAAVAYLDSEFTDFEGAPGLPAFGGTQDLTGARANYSPEWQGNLALQYEGALGGGYSFLVRGDLFFVSEQNIGGVTDANPQTLQDGYQLLSAVAELQGPSDRWTLSIFGENLTDEGYCRYAFTQTLATTLGFVDPDTGGALQRCNVGEPRTYGVRLRTEF